MTINKNKESYPQHTKFRALCYALIALTILANAVGLFFPVLRNDDAALYASIAKNMLQNHDWINLTLFNHDWLDKPHFPFWLTALAYSIFGINSFAYILPGFLFNLLGAIYTYRLAKELYSDNVGLVAAVIYLSSIHLMLSAIDVRAEVYLLGTIMPACFYWYRYNQQSTYQNLLLGALFTACAVMTKGIFVLLTISSGLLTIWVYTKQYTNIIKTKWLIALLISFIFILPELVALYIQFDLYPEKHIFNLTHVSGIKWFLWDSQFGRFFNTGPIIHGGSESFSHYFFFMHVFLWSFLPWTFIFLVAVYAYCCKRSPIRRSHQLAFYYLAGSFLPTFILFSVSRFQLDYYINILLPFAAILCASWIWNYGIRIPYAPHKIFYIQVGFAVILLFLLMGLSLLIFTSVYLFVMLFSGLLILVLFIIFIRQNDLLRVVLYPVISTALAFIFFILIYGVIYSKYDTGYLAANFLNSKKLLVVDYNVNSLALAFHSKNRYLRVGDELTKLRQIQKPYYIFLKDSDLAIVKTALVYTGDKVSLQRVINGVTIDILAANLLSRTILDQQMLEHYLIIKIE